MRPHSNPHLPVLFALVAACSQPSAPDDIGSSTAALVSPNREVGHNETSHPGSTMNGQQSEQSVVQTFGPNGERLFIAGYIDTTNQYNPDGTTVAGDGSFTLMGWSIREWPWGDWEPQPQFDIPPTAGSLRSDPWLTTDLTHERVWYVQMTGTAASPDRAEGFAIAYSEQGGVPGSWNDPLFHVDLGQHIDKPSIAVSPDGDRLYIAYINFDTAQVEVIFSDDNGENWSTPVAVIPPVSLGFPVNPIIRTMPVGGAADDNVYLSFQHESATGDQALFFAMSIGTRGESFSVMPPFETGLFAPPFSTHPSFAPTIGRNRMMHAFHIDPGNLDCQVVFDDGGTIYFRSTTDGVTWTPRVPVAQVPAGHRFFQAQIAGTEDRIAATFYDQDVLTAETQVLATTSNTHGVTWAPTQQLSLGSSGAPLSFLPCAGDIDGSVRFFGDYIGLVGVQQDEGGTFSDRFLAMWADSRDGCTSVLRRYTIHQHTMEAEFE